MFNQVRAIGRIARVLVMTALAIMALFFRKLIAPRRHAELADIFRHYWARQAVRILGMKVAAEGPQPRAGSLVVSNHRSYTDPPAILAVTRCTMLSKAEVAGMPIIGFGAKSVGILFVNRKSIASRSASLEKIAEAVKKGASVAVFPEGTTNAGEKLLPFQPGIFNLAARNGLEVVPMALAYSQKSDAWGDESMFTHFKRCFGRRHTCIRLVFGEPVRHDDPKELKKMAEDWIVRKLKEIEPA